MQLNLFHPKPSTELAPVPCPAAPAPRRTFASLGEYYQSEQWATKRLFALHRADHRCERCYSKSRHLHVHHVTYDRIYNERPEDLEVLCPKCHEDEKTANIKD